MEQKQLKIKNKHLRLCNYCFSIRKKHSLIKCFKCKKEYCFKCLIDIGKDRKICNNCLIDNTKLVEDKALLILTE